MKFGVVVIGVAMILAVSSVFAQQTSPKWGPHVDFEVKPGTDRSIGEADFVLPLMQDSSTLFFGNARLRRADHDNQEGNFGLVVRRMLDSGWNIGGYSYYDRRRSPTGNTFNQITFGAEALGRDWDLRANTYLPQGDRVRTLGTTASGGGTTASIVGTAVQVTTAGITTFTSEERALKGYDVEAGWRVPVWAPEADKQLRIYAGGYHFSDGVVRVSGPRVRAELAMYEIPALAKGAQVMFGAEYQDDDVRGSQGFVSVRLRIPLGGASESASRLNWQERRMTAPTVRDVDVVTQARTAVSATTPAVVESTTTLSNGQSFTVLSSTSTTGAALPGAVAAAGANSIVVLNGTFNTTAATNLQPGQTLMGTGDLTVRTPSGKTFAVAMPGATISTTDPSINSGVVNMAANSTLTGMTLLRAASVSASLFGVYAPNTNGASIINNSVDVVNIGTSGSATGVIGLFDANTVIRGNTVRAEGLASANGILASGGGGGVLISGNTVVATASRPTGIYMDDRVGTISGNSLTVIGNGSFFSNTRAIFMGNNAQATVTENTLNASAGTNNYTVDFLVATFLPGSTANIITAGSCHGSTVAGSMSFTNGTTCP